MRVCEDCRRDISRAIEHDEHAWIGGFVLGFVFAWFLIFILLVVLL